MQTLAKGEMFTVENNTISTANGDYWKELYISDSKSYVYIMAVSSSFLNNTVEMQSRN